MTLDVTAALVEPPSEPVGDPNGKVGSERVEAPARSAPVTDPGLGQWQDRLRPFMQRMLGLLSGIFVIALFWQMHTVQQRVLEGSELKLDSSALAGIDCSSLGQSAFACARWRTLAALEANVMQRRYHQATAALLARLWFKALGFITGMILCLVGAAFILGKISDTTPAQLQGEAPSAKFLLTTTSPGIILATLGTLLMVVTITSNPPTEVKDGAAYSIYDRMIVGPDTGLSPTTATPRPTYIPGFTDTAASPPGTP
ncbi:MAG TPA: hypothetical protein VES88_12005 [Gemmatimonadaceae bacterium]|nr:hypothetical protein [Gemmatimonadaceae bacterium]